MTIRDTARLAFVFSFLLAGGGQFVDAHAAAKVDPQPRGNAGPGAIWVTRDEIMALPMSGPAWTALKNQADQSAGTPDLSNQDQNNNVYVMAKAIVYVRTGISSYRDEVVQNCMAAIDTELGGRTLALGRELAAYVIAAELVGLDPDDDTVFRAWLRRTLTETLDGRTLQSTHEDRPNNWGTLAGGSRAAVAVYLGDQTEIARTAQVFKGWLGDRASFAGFAYQFGGQGADTWMPDPSQPTPVNPMGATVQGHNVDGALPDDISRGGSFAWPPGHTGYAWEGLSGAAVQAEILARQGYDCWNWEDRAMLRATEYLMYLDNEFGGWWTDDDDEQFVPWLINRAYGTNYRSHNPARTGKIMAWTDYTHSGPSNLPPDSSRPAPVTTLR